MAEETGKPRLTKLDPVLKDIETIQRTDLFGLEKDQIVSEQKQFDPYKSLHKSTVQGSIFFGPIFIQEAVGIEIIETDTKTPVYHYASSHYNFMLRGKYMVRGNLYVYETKTSQLQATIAKYKILLEQDHQEEKVREIAMQRMNLFTASAEQQLIARYGTRIAALKVTQALEQVASEVISGLEWRIPKLVFVSGDITDDSPLVDVFEDVDLNKDSKAVMNDGATQIRVYGFIGKKRPVRDKLPEIKDQGKWELDVQTTVQELVRRFVASVKERVGVKVKQETRPWPLYPNNLVHTGVFPDSITGWGPKMCMTSFLISQNGIPGDLYVASKLYFYRTNTNEQGEEYESKMEKDATFTIGNVWKYLYPDPDLLLAGIRAISATVPTSPAMAYQWVTPPGSFSQDSPFIYQEEQENWVSGSVLASSFIGVTFRVPNKPNEITTHRVPVRDYSFAATPYVKSGSKEMTDYIPVHAALGRKSVKEFTTVPWKDQTCGLQITDGYQYEQWFYLVPDGIQLASLLTVFGISWITEIIEDITLGILGNVDGVNNTEMELDEIPVGITGVDTLGVQVFPIAMGRNWFENYFLDPFKAIYEEIESTLFGDGIDREDAIEILADSDNRCVFDACKYIWTIRDIRAAAAENLYAVYQCRACSTKFNYRRETPQMQFPATVPCTSCNELAYRVYEPADVHPQMIFSIQWDREAIAKMDGNYEVPIALVRVFSETPDIPGSASHPRIRELRDHAVFIDSASSTPCSQLDVDIDIRTNRNMIEYEERYPWKLFRQDIPNLFQKGKQNIMNDMTIWHNTMVTQGTVGVVRAYIAAGIIGATFAPMWYSAALAFDMVASAIDITEMTYNTITEIPGLSQALDYSKTLGIDLKGIWRDSKINDSEEIGLRNVVIYTGAIGYVILASRLSADLALQIKERLSWDDVTRLIGDEPYLKSLRNKTKTLYGGGMKIDNMIHTYLVSEFRSQFEGREGWRLVKLTSKQLDRLNLGLDYPLLGNTKTGAEERYLDQTDIENYEAYLLVKESVKPSPLVLDKIIREGPEDMALPEDGETEEEEVRKGFELL